MRVRSLVLLPAAVFTCTAALALAARAAEPVLPIGPGQTTYAQHLVDTALAAHPEVAALQVHTTPAGQMKLGVNAAGDRFDVKEPLKDVSGETIGTLDVVFRYVKNQNTTAAERAASEIQAFFGKHVLSEANLMDPYPYSADYTPDNAAQALVDATMARHPELIVLGMHVTLPDGRGNVMLGCNIGRIGKKADEDDMRVVNTEASNFEVAANGKRYEVELVLRDASGKNIGALGTVFRYTAGDDKAALNARAVAVRDEMARAIPRVTALLVRPALTLTGTTKLPGYHGDFDHFAVDMKNGRLFLAGEDGAELEVLDLATGALLKSVKGYGVPHSLLMMPGRNELLVVDGTKPSQVIDATTLALKRTISIPAGADSVDYDAATQHLWVVTGGKDVPQPDCNLVELDPATGAIVKKIHFDASHVEALTIEQHGDKLYINVSDKNAIAVVDKNKGAIVAWWPFKEAEQNAAFAFDERNHRLFDVARKPGTLVVLDTAGGRTVASFKAPERADQVVWDEANRRIYVTGGDGFIGVFEQIDADHYTDIGRIPSAPGAKTAILVPSLNRLYVAASPGEAPTGGAVLRYDVTPRGTQ